MILLGSGSIPLCRAYAGTLRSFSCQPLGSAPLLAAPTRGQRGGTLLQRVTLDPAHVVARQRVEAEVIEMAEMVLCR